MLSDLDFVVAVEQDARNLTFITPWERTQHEGALRFPDSRHFIVEAGDDWEQVGFVILQIGATIVHLRRGESRQIGLNLALLVAAGVAVWLATTWL